MPNILLLGGAGYLGLALGQALKRTGLHDVWATTRDAKNSNKLLANEIQPLVGQLSDRSFIGSAITDNRIDVIVDISQAYEDATAILETVRDISSKRAATLKQDGAIGPKLGFVYCSGSWVHGSPGHQRNSDSIVPGTSFALDKPATIVSWRPAHEQAVLASQELLDVAVLRPGAIFGRGSWVWGLWWENVLAASKSGSTGPIEVPADEKTRTGIVHVDDAADGFVATIARLGTLGSWPVFDLISETVPIDTIMQEVARVLNAKGQITYTGARGNAFFEAVALVCNSTSARANAVLGWYPKRLDFVRQLPILVAAWAAGKEQ